MKKFYIPIFTAAFLLTSFLSQGQTFNSIPDNSATNYTLDDGRFWVGGIPPPDFCTGCVLNIFTSVKMVPEFGGTTSIVAGDGPWLNHITLDNVTLKIQGPGTVLTINTYVSLINGTQVLVGTDPTFNVSIILNDQVDMDAASSIQLGNINCYIDANNSGAKPIIGPYDDYFNLGTPDAGIYNVLTVPVGGYNYSYALNASGIGYNATAPPPPTVNFAFYNFNCGGPGGCTFGIINGPATTSPDAQYGIIFGATATLPVQLVQFLASKNDDGTVKLSWATSQEQNAGYYDVERSGDLTAWTTIGTVKAKGYSSTTTNYSFKDKLPLDGSGYYRLKMVDLDGKFKYSKTVSVTADKNSRPLVIYSNPFSDLIRLKVNVSRAQNLTMTVSDMLGKTYINKSYQAQSGDNFVNLQPAVGGSGMYILRIHGDSYDQTVKLEKQ